MNKERIRHMFTTLVSIDSPSKEEQAVGTYIKEQLKDLKPTMVVEDEAGKAIGGNCGNIIAKWEKTADNRPAILFSAHMDCVTPCIGVEPVLEDGVYRSKGDTVLGSDDKAGLTAILEGIRLFLEQKIEHGTIWVVFTISEEIGLLGAKGCAFDFGSVDMAYALDIGGAPGLIVTEGPGQNSVDITLHGKTAHAGLAPETGINALVMAGQGMINCPCGRIDDETTANIGTIQGGTATNIVPDKAVLRGEVRSLCLEKLDRYTEDMKRAFEEAARAMGGKVDIQIQRSYDPIKIEETSATVQCAKEAALALGYPTSIEKTGGGSDANVFYQKGIPMALLAVGMTYPHTTSEEIQEAHLYESVQWVCEILKQGNK